jgi:hypothetical protein
MPMPSASPAKEKVRHGVLLGSFLSLPAFNFNQLSKIDTPYQHELCSGRSFTPNAFELNIEQHFYCTKAAKSIHIIVH